MSKLSFKLGLTTGFFGVLLLVGCATAPKHNESEHLAAATLWQQSSGEYRALAYQTFHFARMQLDQNLKNRKSKKPAAIIADVDETLLDNSAYEAQLIAEGKSYPYRWTEFCNKAVSPALPGAVEFMKYAHSKGVRIFYVTNRKLPTKVGTIKNLRESGFPEVTEDRLFFKTTTSDKEPRRSLIRAKHDVVMLLGDNLNDFESIYADKTVAERAEIVSTQKMLYGTRYIVLPNPMYGDWAGAVYDYNWALSPLQKERTRQSKLKGFQ